MDFKELYTYALGGALETLRACEHLSEMCSNIFDEDAANEHAEKIAEVKEDINFICNVLGYDPKVFDNM